MRITDELREFLLSQAYVVVCIETDLGEGNEVVVVIKTERELANALGNADAPVEIGWIVHKTVYGPVICMAARCENEKAGSFACETFFDVSQREDAAALNILAVQQRLRAAFFDEDLDIIKVVEIHWDEIQRLRVEQTMDRADELFERCENYDLVKAKDIFYDDFPMDRLLSAAFGVKSG